MSNAYKSLRDFMKLLEGRDLLRRVKTPVSPILEMTEIQTRLLASNGPAVLFENVSKVDGQHYDFPALVNLFGTVERVALGMGRKPEELRQVGETLAFLRQPEPARGPGRGDHQESGDEYQILSLDHLNPVALDAWRSN